MYSSIAHPFPCRHVFLYHGQILEDRHVKLSNEALFYFILFRQELRPPSKVHCQSEPFSVIEKSLPSTGSSSFVAPAYPIRRKTLCGNACQQKKFSDSDIVTQSVSYVIAYEFSVLNPACSKTTQQNVKPYSQDSQTSNTAVRGTFFSYAGTNPISLSSIIDTKFGTIANLQVSSFLHSRCRYQFQ